MLLTGEAATVRSILSVAVVMKSMSDKTGSRRGEMVGLDVGAIAD